MLIRIVKMELEADKVEVFKEHFQSIKHRILAFQGCEKLELLTETNSPTTCFTISHWTSEHDLENYRSSPFFIAVWKKVKPMFKSKTQAWSLQSDT